MSTEKQNNQPPVIIDLQLETTPAPINVEEIAKEKGEWCVEVVPGINIAVWYAQGGEKPYFVYQGHDKSDGLKYGFYILFAADYHYHKDYYKIERLNETVTRITKDGDTLDEKWANYLYNELNKVPEFETSETSFVAMSDKKCHVWTTNRQEFSPLLSAISGAIRSLAKQTDLKEVVPTTKKKYYDYVNNELPLSLANAFEYAMDVYEQLSIESKVIGVIVDVEKSELVFTKEFGTDDLHNEEVFYTYEEPMIKTCDEWCTELQLINSQEACHWITDAIAKAQKTSTFKNIDRLTIMGNYMYDDEGEMDTVFQK